MLQRDGARDARFRRDSQRAKIQLSPLLIDGDGERSTLRNGIQVTFDRFPRLQPLIVSNPRVFARAHFLDQAVEFHLLVELLERHQIGFARHNGIHGEFYWHGGLNGCELLAEQDLIAILLATLTICFAIDFGRALQRRFYRSESLDQLFRAFVADAGSARYVVDGVALQTEQVSYLRR